MKVLIIGLGSIAKKHISAIREVKPKAAFFALRSSEKAIPVAGVANIFSWDDLTAFSFDFAIVSNPTAKHREAISRLIPLKIPLFIEKPLFSDLEDKGILQNLAQKNIQSYVACNLRFLECLQFVKQYLGNKRINEVNSYCGSYLPDWRPGTDYRKTYSANKKLGGGVHIDLIHEIDYSYWLFGQPERVNKLFTSNSSLAIDAHDYANYIFQYQGFNVNIVLNYYRRDPKREMEVVFDDHTITVDLLQNSVRRGTTPLFEAEQTIKDTYHAQMLFFMEQVVEKRIQFNTAHEAFEILKICLQHS